MKPVPTKAEAKPSSNVPAFLWRVITWFAGWLAVTVLAAAVANLRWDLTGRISPSILIGTRSGACKVFKDWHGDPAQGLRIERHAAPNDWSGRWLYDTSLGWFELPLWLAAPLLVVPLLLIWHSGLRRRRRFAIRRISSMALALIGLFLFGVLAASFRWEMVVGQSPASFKVVGGGATLSVPYTGPRVLIDGSLEAAIKRPDKLSLMWLPSWRNSAADYTLEMPLWLPLIAIGLASALLFRLSRFDARMMPDHCRSCGYNRVGLALASLCPECGASNLALSKKHGAPLTQPDCSPPAPSWSGTSSAPPAVAPPAGAAASPSASAAAPSLS